MDFETIYFSYFQKMKRFAMEYVVSEADAENIAQDVFTELWEKRDMLSTHTNLIAFLFTSIRNRSLNHLRHKMVEQEATLKLQEEYRLTLGLNFESLESFGDAVFSEREIEKMISNALDSLPDKCREIFIMSKIEGRKQKDIASELNISLSTVETQIGIAYRKLRIALKDHTSLFLFLFCL